MAVDSASLVVLDMSEGTHGDLMSLVVRLVRCQRMAQQVQDVRGLKVVEQDAVAVVEVCVHDCLETLVLASHT